MAPGRGVCNKMFRGRFGGSAAGLFLIYLNAPVSRALTCVGVGVLSGWLVVSGYRGPGSGARWSTHHSAAIMAYNHEINSIIEEKK